MSDWDISRLSLAAKRGENFRQTFGQRRRDSLERLVKQQAFGPDRQRTPQRDQLLLAAAEACVAVEMIGDGGCA